jgi:ABC-type polysaccharide/polyol phosphate transport system ATPase subunit
LQGVTFEAPPGAAVGIVGANGAGKTTLLRAIAGILPLSEGRITVRGRTSTMLSLSIGFNSALTGRENVMLSGLAMGSRAEDIEERYDEIVAFADIGEFIEYPVRTYSTGMRSRLAFSVAVHIEPDILLIDEALSTGDASFKDKSMRRMREMYELASTILLVTHDLGAIRELATHCLWLNEGRVQEFGAPEEVLPSYLDFMKLIAYERRSQKV